MKVILQIDGKKRSFSNVENISIEEENVKSSKKDKNFKIAQKPTEGKWFEVKPLTIDETIFQEKKKDRRQEETRKLILEAFEELKKKPEKYGKNFRTMMPENNWKKKSLIELKELACEIGDHMANWVEQSLEWAQRIANGESWEDLCNKPDTAKWYRVIIWKEGQPILVGGSVMTGFRYTVSDVSVNIYKFDRIVNHCVPLIVG